MSRFLGSLLGGQGKNRKEGASLRSARFPHRQACNILGCPGGMGVHWGQLGFSDSGDMQDSDEDVLGCREEIHCPGSNPVVFNTVPETATASGNSAWKPAENAEPRAPAQTYRRASSRGRRSAICLLISPPSDSDAAKV